MLHPATAALVCCAGPEEKSKQKENWCICCVISPAFNCRLPSARSLASPNIAEESPDSNVVFSDPHSTVVTDLQLPFLCRCKYVLELLRFVDLKTGRVQLLLAMTEVFLHVYDVANSESVKTNNAIVQLNKIFKDGIGLGGIFHSAIEVYGKQEWSFGYCESGSGVFSCRRTENPMYVYRESLSLGNTSLSPSKVKEILIKLSLEWEGSSYDLLSKNCNHFCNDFCTRLGVQKIPGWVNRFANAGETAVEVAETTMKRLRQAKTEVVSASKTAYRVLFGGSSASAVSPDPGLLEGSSSNGGGNVLRLSFMKTPVSLLSKIGLGSVSQSVNERLPGDESVSSKNGSGHSGDMLDSEPPS